MTFFPPSGGSVVGVEGRPGKHPKNWGYTDYLDGYFSLSSFGDLARLRLFPGAKDVSESWGALKAAQRTLKAGGSRGRVKCVSIGDGSTPRTACLAAFLEPKWETVSVDPCLISEWEGEGPKGVKRLQGVRGTVEKWMEGWKKEVGWDKLVVFMVHSHARLTGTCDITEIRARYDYPETVLVNMPCCPGFGVEKDVGRRPEVVYEDYCVFSDKRRIEMWTWDKGNA